MGATSSPFVGSAPEGYTNRVTGCEQGRRVASLSVRLSALARKFSNESGGYAAAAVSTSLSPSRRMSRARSFRVNFHSNGLAASVAAL